MSDSGAAGEAPSDWRIPGWYRRVGQMSWLFLGIVAAVALLTWVFAATSEITALLVLGAFMAIVFLPTVDWLADRGLARGLACVIVLIGLVVLFTVVAWVTGIAIVDQADELSENLAEATARIQEWLADTPVDPAVAERVRSTTAEAGPTLAGGVANQAVSLVDSAFGFVTGTILGAIVFYYLLKDGSALFRSVADRWDDAETRSVLHRVGERTVINIQSYFRGRTAMAVVNGAAIGLAAALLGVPAAGAIVVVNFFGSYIPCLGAFIGGAFAVLMALGEGGLGLALIVLGITLTVNLLLENLLEPVLLGGSLHMHPLLILLATSLGGVIAGMIGLLLVAPALAIMIDIQRELKASGFFDEQPAH